MKLRDISSYEYDRRTRRLFNTLTEDYILLRINKNPIDLEDNVVTMKGIEWVLKYYLVHNDFEKIMKILRKED